MKWLTAILSWFRRKDKPAIVPQPMPAPVSVTILDDSEVAHGFTHSTPVTDRISFERITESNIYFAGATRTWDGGDLVGECHMLLNRDGTWHGGKFDHIRNNTTARDFKNIHNGYQVWSSFAPVRGETIAFYMISYDKTKRTNAIFATWK